MHRALFLALVMIFGVPAAANAASHSARSIEPAGSSVERYQPGYLQLSDDDSEVAQLRRMRTGQALVGFAVGMQSFQVIFAILARALADPVGPWAPGDSMAVEAILALSSIPAVPLGVVGFKRLAANPRRGTAIGLLQGGLYACSYGALHLLFSGISEALPSGGQGNAFGFVFFGLPLMVSHFTLGVTLTIVGAVLLKKSKTQQGRSQVEGADQRHARHMAKVPVLAPAPLIYRDGGGLALVAVF